MSRNEQGHAKNPGPTEVEIQMALDLIRDQALENAPRWGLQDREVLSHALNEELGEWSKAILEQKGVDEEESELIDSAAVIVALIVGCHRREQRGEGADPIKTAKKLSAELNVHDIETLRDGDPGILGIGIRRPISDTVGDSVEELLLDVGYARMGMAQLEKEIEEREIERRNLNSIVRGIEETLAAKRWPDGR